MKFIALKNPKKYNLNDFPSFIVVFSYGGRRRGGVWAIRKKCTFRILLEGFLRGPLV